jgi:hypothetical protein
VNSDRSTPLDHSEVRPMALAGAEIAISERSIDPRYA